MSAGRRRALALFPEHRRRIQDGQYTVSIYQLFFDLLPMTLEAHAQQDEHTLERVYEYAEWCWHQRKRAPDIYNAVAVAFYEHLVDHQAALRDIPQWLKPDIFDDARVLFEARLSAEQYTELLEAYNKVNGTHFK